MTEIHCLDVNTRTTLCGLSRVGLRVASEKSYLELTDGELEDVGKCPACEQVRVTRPVPAGEAEA